jgi:hypothetical protein
MLLTYLIIAILLCLIYFLVDKKKNECYTSCRDCTGNVITSGGTSVINPFIWPYSGTPCVDDLYIQNKDTGLDVGFNTSNLYSLTTPDNVIMTN